MGAVNSILLGKSVVVPDAVERRESKPTILKIDKRRQNSLVFSVTEWLEAESDQAKLEVLALHTDKKNKKKNTRKKKDNISEAAATAAAQEEQRISRFAVTAEGVAIGSMRLLREQVVAHFTQINKKYLGMWGGNTLLHVVCREGYARMVEFMMDGRNISHIDYTGSEIDYNARNDKGRTPLHLIFTPPHETICAARFGLDIETGMPKAKRPDDVFVDSDWILPGGPAERQSIISMLIGPAGNKKKLKADPNAKDYHNYTALHYACLLGWRPSVAILIANGANPDTTNATGQNPLMCAAQYGHAKVVELYLEATETPIEAKNLQGDTALTYAVLSGHAETVDMLCSFGANVNCQGNSFSGKPGSTPLFLACEANNAAIVQVLITYRAALNPKALKLLHGDAKAEIHQRLEQDKRDKELDFHRRLSSGGPRMDTRGRPTSSLGMWLPYRDKRGGGIFYYNTVSRICQRDQPLDYRYDPSYIMKEATFGLHFYH